jgi:hypothetical protein
VLNILGQWEGGNLSERLVATTDTYVNISDLEEGLYADVGGSSEGTGSSRATGI